MADERPPAGTSNSRPSSHSGSFSPFRALLVLVVFVIATLLLVGVGTRPAVIGAPTTAPSTTTTAAGGSTTTTAAGAAGSTTSTTKAHGTTTTARSSHGHHAAATTTTTTIAPSSVSVLVANATSTNGLAAHYSATIGAGGFSMQTPTDANTTEATSAVYYAAGQQQPAASIATSIGVAPTAVLPLTSATPVTYPATTDVVVVIGQDLAAKSS
jgi:cytoskeletal protein RodZ